ncbi:MAG: inositol 2-dehydrogenase [Candidatus Hinthialibacter antarcticus]|nr:inositol 2-dehydrogenase [Candidatus Hinthialibacter antarcticus]
MNTSNKVNVGVIGTGRIGRVHAEHLAYRISNARLEAICDVNFSSAQECAAQLNVKNVYDSAEPILADGKIDAVVICSSTNTHAPLIEQAAQAGKHVFCEKPIDYDLARIDHALKVVEQSGVKFMVGFNRRFDPNFLEVHRKITSGAIGDPQILKITSRDPSPPPIEYVKVSGGMFLDMTIHDFDMARYLVGSDITGVYAAGGVLVDPRIGDAGDIDTALITLHFSNGAIGVIDNSRQAAYGYDQRVEVFGSDGMISAENNTPTRTQISNKDGIHSPLPLHFFMDRYIDSYIEEMRQFIDSVVNDTPPPVTGIDGRQPVEIGLAAQLSLKENRLVNL